jgi:enoyl-CoA hydratase/carnithine racemase
MTRGPFPEPSHEFKAVKVDAADGVLTITLNRPDALNAFDDTMRADFLALQWRIESDADIRVIVFKAEGDRAFGSGADISWFEADWATARFRVEYRWVHDFFDTLERVEIPVIAAIHGICACGGLELAMACDFRMATRDATFRFTEGNINLIPGSGGCSRLARMIGVGWAKEMVLAGAVLDAEKAMQVGLVTRLAETREALYEEADALAAKLAGKAPQALGLAKAVLNTSNNIDETSARVLERVAQSVLLKTEDHAEGIRAFREKRKPGYTGR